MLTVTAPAEDRSLLTIPELRGAVGVGSSVSDGDLQALGDRISSIIMRHCNIASDGLEPPTLREETLEQTFRNMGGQRFLMLARRPVRSVTSVVIEGEALLPIDYEIDRQAGLLERLQNDRPCSWLRGKIVVTYKAGFVKVPDDLKMAAIKLARLHWAEKSRDPTVKSQTVPDVLSQTFRDGGENDGTLPADICDLLSPYRNHGRAT